METTKIKIRQGFFLISDNKIYRNGKKVPRVKLTPGKKYRISAVNVNNKPNECKIE